MASSVMRSTLPHPFGPFWRGVASDVPATGAWLLRGGLILGCGAAIGVAAWAGDPIGFLLADPALARLLRGMALIKAVIALAAVGIVFMRLAWPVSRTAAAGYLAGCWALAGSSALIWQLSYIVPAALLFHAAALSLLLVGWRER